MFAQNKKCIAVRARIYYGVCESKQNKIGVIDLSGIIIAGGGYLPPRM